MTEANLIRCYYRSVGPQLSIDAFCVDFEVGEETYTHTLPNDGWSYQTPALAFLGYVEKKPTDVEGTSMDLSGKTAPVAKTPGGVYSLQQKDLVRGSQKLKEADWFDPNGQVWDSQGVHSNGMTINHDGGSQASVSIEDKE